MSIRASQSETRAHEWRGNRRLLDHYCVALLKTFISETHHNFRCRGILRQSASLARAIVASHGLTPLSTIFSFFYDYFLCSVRGKHAKCTPQQQFINGRVQTGHVFFFRATATDAYACQNKLNENSLSKSIFGVEGKKRKHFFHVNCRQQVLFCVCNVRMSPPPPPPPKTFSFILHYFWMAHDWNCLHSALLSYLELNEQ